MTAAEEVTQARDDIERITADLYATLVRETHGQIVGAWEDLPEGKRVQFRLVVTDMLHRDVIHVGRRPQKGERPMTGQEAMALDTLGTPP